MNKKTIKKYAKEHKCSIREAQRQLGLEATGNMSVLSSPKGEDIVKEEVFDIKQKLNEENGEGYASSDKVLGSSLGSDNTKFGFSPALTGTVLGLKEGEKSDVIIGENGVFIVNVLKSEKPEATDDLELYKTKLANTGNVDGLLNQAIEKLSDITDNRSTIF